MSNVESPPRVASPAEAPAASPRGRVRYNRVMKLVRRAHLYAGLFMTPWVFLYGVTALLFNHPSAFPDAKVIHFGPADSAGTPLAELPRPDALAARVVEALNASGTQASRGSGYQLVRPAEARFARDVFASVRGDGREHIVRIDPASGKGSVRSQLKAAGKPAPFVPKGGLKLDPPLTELMKRDLPGFLERLGVSGEKAVDRLFIPDLSFLMNADGKTWRVTYSAQSGQLSGRPVSEGNPLTTRTYLLRLHLAHEYPSELDSRWFWALSVDAMFVSMVGWGITGLLMWWQMKNVRKVGILVLIASVVAALSVAIGMHRTFVS